VLTDDLEGAAPAGEVDYGIDFAGVGSAGVAVACWVRVPFASGWASKLRANACISRYNMQLVVRARKG
jgi:hypothetical protein